MTGFETFRYYMSLKLHFTSDYDALKYNFKCSAVKPKSYNNRTDRFFFEKLGSSFTDPEELLKYFVANFVANKTRWIREMSLSDYHKFQGTIDAFTYIFKTDISTIDRVIRGFEADGPLSLNRILSINASGISPIIDLFMKKKISLETVTCIDIHVAFIKDLRKSSNDPLGLYKETFDLIENYKPFFSRWIDYTETKEVLLKTCTS